MLGKLRRHVSFANVTSLLALFVAIGGTSAYAINEWTGDNIVNESLTGADVKGKQGTGSTAEVNGSLTTYDVAGRPANAAVGQSFIDGTLTQWDIKDGSLAGPDVNELGLDATPLRTRVAQGGCQGNSSQDVMVKVGPLCMDKYEASIWTSRTGGTQITGAIPCDANGQNCTNIYARSVAGVTPARNVTWFQAQQALANSGKRLPSNAEWQMAVAGTPDSTACNQEDMGLIENTGANPGCVSNHGAMDMAGNVQEWVADWVPASTNCPNWDPIVGNDFMCLAGAATDTGPGAIVRGGDFSVTGRNGPFRIEGGIPPWSTGDGLGFRGAR